MEILETYVRVFVDRPDLKATVRFYETLTGGKCRLFFDYPEHELSLAAVSGAHAPSFLIIAGSPQSRQPFEETTLTIKVADLALAETILTTNGAVLIEPIQPTPVGKKLRARHPDGMLVEYVQHDPEKLRTAIAAAHDLWSL